MKSHTFKDHHFVMEITATRFHFFDWHFHLFYGSLLQWTFIEFKITCLLSEFLTLHFVQICPFFSLFNKNNFSKCYCYELTRRRECNVLNRVKAFHCSQWALIKRRERIFVVDRSISLFLPFIHHLFFLCSILLIQKHFSWIPPTNVLTVKEKCLRFWAWAQNIEWPFT